MFHKVITKKINQHLSYSLTDNGFNATSTKDI